LFLRALYPLLTSARFSPPATASALRLTCSAAEQQPAASGMTRHAKNACSYAVFSHAERQRLQYGTQSRRTGLDAQKPFNACDLCLHPAEQPVLCSKGHLFCRGCILESLAQQKELNKLALQKWELQQQEAVTKVQTDAAAEKQKQIANFEKLDAALLKGNERLSAGAAAASSASSGASAPAGYVRVETSSSKGVGYVVDRAAVAAHNDPSAPREVQAARAAYLPAFWAPSMAPADVGEAKLTGPPPQVCQCPSSKHPLKLKQLRPVHWHFEREKSEGEVRATSASGATSNQNASFKPICFACKRQLQNQTPMFCVKTCGHVACRVCVDTIMLGKKRSNSVHASSNGASAAAAAAAAESKAADAADGITSTRLACLECDEPCSNDDLVQIVAATGFAASGNALATAKLTPAFRC